MNCIAGEIERVRLKNDADMDPLMTKDGRTMKLYTSEMLHTAKNIFTHANKPDKTNPTKRHHCGQQAQSH